MYLVFTLFGLRFCVFVLFGFRFVGCSVLRLEFLIVVFTLMCFWVGTLDLPFEGLV